MNEIVVLSLEDGAFHEAGPPVDPPSKQKRIRTLKDWIREHGKDGKTYRLAAWLTPPISCKETKTMELIERELPGAKPSPDETPADMKEDPKDPWLPDEEETTPIPEEGPVFLGEPGPEPGI